MENRLKMRISNMFRSSFASCRSKHINDIIKESDFLPQNGQHNQLSELLSPKSRPFSSHCKPKSTLSSNVKPSYMVQENSSPRKKISDREHEPLLVPADICGNTQSPTSPVLPLKTHQALQKRESKTKNKRYMNSTSAKDFPGYKYNNLLSGNEEDDDDKTIFFSSRSLSSDFSESFRGNKVFDKSVKVRRRRAARKEPKCVKVGSFAMVKRSSDPYNDFRTSMVEMIVEKQIFAVKDLEKMLQIFLSLNSYHHHRIIIEVFTEIWEALFSNKF